MEKHKADLLHLVADIIIIWALMLIMMLVGFTSCTPLAYDNNRCELESKYEYYMKQTDSTKTIYIIDINGWEKYPPITIKTK